MPNPRSLPAVRTIGNPRMQTLARHLLAGGTLDPAVSPTMGHILVATIGDSGAGKRYAASLYNALVDLLPTVVGVPGYLAHRAIEEGDTSGANVGPVTRTDLLTDEPTSAINIYTSGPCGPDLKIQYVSGDDFIQWTATPGRKKFKAAFLMGTANAPTVELLVDTVSQGTLDLSTGTTDGIGTLGYAGSAATTFRLEFTGGSGQGIFLGAALTDGADPNQLSVANLAHGGSRPVGTSAGAGHTDVPSSRWIPVWEALELPPMTLIDLHCGAVIVGDALANTPTTVENLDLQDDIATPVKEFVEHYLDAGLTLMQNAEGAGDSDPDAGKRKAAPPDVVYRVIHNRADLYEIEEDKGLDPGVLIALADEFRTAMGDGALAAGPTGIGLQNDHAYLHTHPDDPFDLLTDDDLHYTEAGADVLARAVTRNVYFHGLFDVDRDARRRAGLVSFQLSSDQSLGTTLAVMPLTSDVTVTGLDATLDTTGPATNEIVVNEAATVELHAREMARKSSGSATGDPPELHVERDTGSGFVSFVRAEGTIAGATGSDYLLDASRVAAVAAGHKFRLRARGATGQTLLAADTFLVIERVD